MRRATVAALACALTVAAAFLAQGSQAQSTRASIGTRSTSVGTILVDSRGRTLYLWEKDHGGRSACSGACARAWPPVLTRGKPTAHGRARASLLGTTRRSDGKTQVTYNRHPLYRFAGDQNRPGRTTGQGSNGFGAEWYVVAPNGRAIEDE